MVFAIAFRQIKLGCACPTVVACLWVRTRSISARWVTQAQMVWPGRVTGGPMPNGG
jgi:hypothetical protein